MKRALWIAIAVVVMGQGTRAQTPSDAARMAAAKEELRQMWNELNDAVRRHDQAALERIYAEDFVFVHARVGGVISRAENIKRAMSAAPDAALPSPAFDDIKLYGDVAVLRSTSGNTFGTTIYTRRDGRWRILQVQGTPLPSPRTEVVVDRSVLASYAGKYEQAPGRVATVTLEADGLRVRFPNGITWTVLPLSDDHFFVKDSLNQIMFHRTDNGRAKHFTAWLPNGDLSKGTKID